jgi:iron-only hydrogenase group A
MMLAGNEYRTACRGCHGGCVHILTVEDGRVSAVRPDPDAPLNKGRACTKGITIIEQMYHPDRITRPMKRSGSRGAGTWERISWDEAYDTIAEKLGKLIDNYGAECISMLTGTGRHHMAHYWRFSHVLGTPNAASSGPLVCLDPRVHAGKWTSGTYCSVDYYGKTKPGGLLVWGSNPAISGADGELQWFVKDALKARTPLIVVDTQPTELARRATLWLRPRPGTDGALALGILNIIIKERLYDREFVENWTYGFEVLKERCAAYDVGLVSKNTWLTVEQIRRAARLIASVKPLGLEWGCAIEQGVNSTQTCRTLYMLMGITGNYDVPGGFVESQEIAPPADILNDRLTPEMKAKCLSGGYPHTTSAPMAHPLAILDAMASSRPYKIRALLVHANNALLSLPESQYVRDCLMHLDFMVYMDFFMTPTGEMADIFLPAAFWPELDEVFCMPEFSEQVALCMRKLVQVGECKSDEEVFFELSRRMGLDYGANSLEEIFDGQLEEMGRRRPSLAGISFRDFKNIAYVEPEREYYRYKARGGFPTPTGKFELFSRAIKAIDGEPLPFWQEPPESPVSRPDVARDFPLVLTTGGRKHPYFISNNRQIASLRRQSPFPRVNIHPDTAAKYGVADGDWVYIETRRGKITQKAKLMDGLDPRVINCELGWWYPEAGAPLYGWNESNANILTVSEGPCDPFFGSYQLRALLCEISRNENCKIEERYYNSKLYRELPLDSSSNSVVLDPNKCILCGGCVDTCQRVQGIGALEIVTRDGVTFVTPKNAENMAKSSCVGCGQCTAVCPSGGIRLKSSLEAVREALRDPAAHVAVQVAPSVRVGIGAACGLPKSENAMPRLTSALRRLGFDAVYDTTFGADLTIVEEANELLERISSGSGKPLFTSCCPAWVRYCEQNHPRLADCISTCRSPQQMLAAVLRERYREEGSSGGKRQVVISVMPCTAKKDEITRSESATYGQRDVDFVLTTRELTELLRENDISLASCPPDEPDVPYTTGSGAGVIFGVSGGVTEAALRYLLPEFGEAERELFVNSPIRSDGAIRETELSLNGKSVKIAVASGLANADKLMRRLLGGEHFDLVEVMACPGGCVMGGGQPSDLYNYRAETDREARTGAIFAADEESGPRRANDNPHVNAARGAMTRGKAHELLHRNQD